MAYISRECVSCTDGTKSVAGEFHGKDENGGNFNGNMYICDNYNCPINRKRIKTQKRRCKCTIGK